MRLPSPRRSSRAFTLIEMLLAISIAVSMLIVALLFYRQTADLRNQILLESERLATLRLLSDRIAGDLRLAAGGTGFGQEFRGDTGSMSFVRVSSPGGQPGFAQGGDDRVRVTYVAVMANDGTNQAVRGLDRLEETLMAPRSFGGRSAQLAVPTGFTTNTLGAFTNSAPDPLTELVRHLHFRYWDGSAWVEGWTNSTPPPGVEVVLGADPQPAETVESESPGEQFRRVVFVPAGLHHRPPPEMAPSSTSPP